ncbi:hypothetical protein [Massilia aerilata]|uniref:DUF3592 domain-containing protein n=1 Tax=Massilia aerilata TaxID=453817 RepID=A0ABW0RXA5_9BURK
MALDIKIYSGVAKNWNAAHFGTHVAYSLIEFEGGKKIGEMRATERLNDVLEPALRSGQALKLHVAMPVEGSILTLIAFEQADGVTFAEDVPPLPAMLALAPRLALIFGILLLPAFGLGILLLGAWSSMRSRIRPLIELREYVQRLPRATLVKS